jgi:hypothetical protein
MGNAMPVPSVDADRRSTQLPEESGHCAMRSGTEVLQSGAAPQKATFANPSSTAGTCDDCDNRIMIPSITRGAPP